MPRKRVAPRPGTGRAIGLSARRVVRESEALSSSRKTGGLSNDHGGQAQSGEGRFLAAVSARPRRRPCGNGVVAFVVRENPYPTASFCPLCLLTGTLSGGVSPAVVAAWADVSTSQKSAIAGVRTRRVRLVNAVNERRGVLLEFP